MVGSNFISQLVAEGHEVVNMSRSNKDSGMTGWQNLKWDGRAIPEGVKDIDVVVNLAGANIGQRWTESYKKTVLDSRVNATRACVDFINSQENKPKVFISASGSNFYGDNYRGIKTEEDGPGEGFLSGVCQAWEAEAEKSDTRTILMRIAPVLSLEGGPLEKLVTPYKMLVGGPTGSGDQGFPWIHLKDLLAAMHFFVENESTEGPYNLSAPQQVSNSEFAKALGKAMNRPSFFRIPKFALQLIFGEMSVVLWGGGNTKPAKLLSEGFHFDFPTIDEALAEIFQD